LPVWISEDRNMYNPGFHDAELSEFFEGLWFLQAAKPCLWRLVGLAHLPDTLVLVRSNEEDQTVNRIGFLGRTNKLVKLDFCALFVVLLGMETLCFN
jgi:hypothetical protein